MSSSATLPRPRQVTMAAWMIIGGSILVVLTVFERMNALNGLETQEAITDFLSRPPGDALGLDVPGVVDVLRVSSMIAAACAAAAAILGFHVLRRHRGARLALSVLAVPLFVTGMVAGGFVSSLVAGACALLWLEPSRDWFAGRPAKTPPEPTRREAAPPTPPPPSGPRPHQGFGTPPSEPRPPAYGPAPYATPTAYRGTASHAHGPSRPRAVVSAGVLIWVFCGLASLVMGVSALVMVVAPDLVFDELARQNPGYAQEGVTDAAIVTATWISAVLVIGWSVAASILAAFVVRGRRAAWLPLLISTAVAAVFCLLAVWVSVVMVLPLAACAVTLSLLLRGDVRAWLGSA